MDVAAAFPSVARGCLLQKTRNTGTDEDLVRWTDSFMRDRRVVMSVDGRGDDAREATTGLPQGSPVSPVLFAIYIAETHEAVESQVEECQRISFVDGVTWLVEGAVNEVVQRLEKCAAASLSWAGDNAVRFGTSKTETILFCRRRKHWREKAEKPIRVGDRTARFARDATKWLGAWLDSAPALHENWCWSVSRARQTVAKARGLTT